MYLDIRNVLGVFVSSLKKYSLYPDSRTDDTDATAVTLTQICDLKKQNTQNIFFKIESAAIE